MKVYRRGKGYRKNQIHYIIQRRYKLFFGLFAIWLDHKVTTDVIEYFEEWNKLNKIVTNIILFEEYEDI